MQFFRGFWIERGKRFVEKQHRRLDGQSARDADALALSTGKVAGIFFLGTFESHHFDIAHTRRTDFGFR